MVVTSHEPVAMETKGHSRELQMFSLSSEPSLDIEYLTQKPAGGNDNNIENSRHHCDAL